MTLQVTTHAATRSDVVVLALAGAPAEGVLDLLADGIAELAHAGQTVVLDLDELMMTRAAALHAFLGRLLATSPTERLVLVCSRLSGRRLLRRWSSDDLQIVGDVPSAIAQPEAVPA